MNTFFKKVFARIRMIYIKNIKIRSLLKDERRHLKKSMSEANQIEFDLRMQMHAVEKAVLIENCAIIKSERILLKIIESLKKYIRLTGNAQAAVISEAVSIVQMALDFAEEKQLTIKHTKKALDNFFDEYHIEKKVYENVRIIEETIDNGVSWEEYESLMKSRHSIRSYEKGIVPESDVLDIVRVAVMCPSTCNRQPCRVYYSTNSDTQDKLRKACGDAAVAKSVPNFMAVTVIKDMFSGGEIFQSWINGGLFCQSLINAIHAKGLGACMFHTTKTSKHYQLVKDILEIPENEDIVALVGYGYLPEKAKYIKMHRREANEVAIKH